ncbi:FMN-binding protein [Streptomyces sp. NPDC002138]|uniref:FMN-binding protein n=1 Tax=Streptomyces sp. NPDC002138 TaxID=3154410 RepID=UPI00332F2FCF
MRRAVLTATGISALVVTLLSLKPHQQSAPSATAPPRPGTVTPQTAASSAAGPPTGTGTFTGDPVDTRYGAVQVSVTLVQGKITAVRVLQAPDRGGRDRQLTSYAVPRLTQEALDAQSADIDAISGASYTSEGYARSLQSALDRARA